MAHDRHPVCYSHCCELMLGSGAFSKLWGVLDQVIEHVHSGLGFSYGVQVACVSRDDLAQARCESVGQSSDDLLA